MYHYILLFINKVLYYIRNLFVYVENPFCDFVIVIVWLGIKSLPRPLRRKASPDPSERRGVPMRTRGIRGRALYLIVFCKILANLHSPPFGGVGGGFFCFLLSLCKTDSYKGVCGTCYSSTPKNDCFQNKVAYLCKQKRKSLTNSPTRPLPRGEECRSQDKPQDV